MALFEARHLSKRFGDRVVLEDISLSFEQGQLSGIMGPNGAGKSTCFNVLTGQFAPDRGQVLLDGQDITGLSPRKIAQKGVARSFQIMSLFDEFTVLENVLFALPEMRSAGMNPFKSVAGDSAAIGKALKIVEQVGLSQHSDAKSINLSYGQRRGAGGRASRAVSGRADPGHGRRGARSLAGADPHAQASLHHRHDRARYGLPVPSG
jgi:branched-chain amino acid transport system ATP-binding protein